MKTSVPENQIWDVVVIGGGPAGMMAAGVAAKLGRSVLLLEKNFTLGKKLLITGGGRCNVTNNKKDVRTMLLRYKGSDKFLYSAFTQHGVAETLAFFNECGMETKEENEGRVFPASNTAQSVFDVLVNFMKEGKVTVYANTAVTNIFKDGATRNFKIQTKTRDVIETKKCIIATGGTSRPETGSTGEGFNWLKRLGHTIIEDNMALVPVALLDEWSKRLSGLTLTDIKLTTYQRQNGKLEKQESSKGKVLFTHTGLSGPTVLNMSKDIGEMIKYGEVIIMLDLFPALDNGTLRSKLQDVLVEESNKKVKNALGKLIPQALVPQVLNLAHIDEETPCHSVRTEERIKLVEQIKNIPLHVKGLLGADKAIVSSGGVALTEVDFKTMESRIVPGLYIIGDTLNIDRPSGGYSLQLCWTTGFVSGSHV